ncbi:hypothetical protein [Streptomyces flavidovirens]|uniref:hypothetical protein n=1 Tax=Streptomyces flavidovirens TaxID=67298 RepID=UPI00369C2C5A
MQKPLITPKQLAANQAHVAAVLKSVDEALRAVAPVAVKVASGIGESVRRAARPA